MNITFVFNNPKGKGLLSAKTLNTIRGLNNCLCDRRVFNYIKSLESNEKLISGVALLRKKYNIPANGYLIKDWSNYPYFKSILVKGRKVEKWKKRLQHEAENLFNSLNVSPFLMPYLNAYNLVVGNFVFLGFGRIFISPYISKGDIGIFIKGNVSKYEFHKFIDTNWKKIQKEMTSIISKERYLPKWKISQRDRLIVKLRDEKRLTFNEIANKITTKYRLDPTDTSVNEDSVKAAYHRAKKKIESIIS